MRHRRRRKESGKSLKAVLPWALVLVATGALVIVSGIASDTRAVDPARALAAMPWNARALAARADTLLLTGIDNRDKVAQARRYATAALSRDATIPSAWRTLALASPANQKDMIAWLEVAEHLSRRDAPTQLALLEWRVEQGDIAGALTHYDIVLRTSSTYDATLFPVLAGAITEPEIRRQLARRLVRAPIWRRRFLSYLAGAPSEAQVGLFADMARIGPLADRDIVGAQATNSVAAGRYALGQRFYSIAAPAEAALPLRNGEFEIDGGIPPFDWQLNPDNMLNVAVNGAAKARRLEMVSERGDGAWAARQLLYLSPGEHQVVAAFGGIEGYGAGIPYLTVTCATGGPALATFEGGAAGRARLGGSFSVPAHCDTQWIELGLRQDASAGRVGVWIDSVAVR